MARQPDDPHVVAEVFAAELGADAHLLSHLVDLRLHLQVAERLSVIVAARGQGVEVARAGQLDRFQGQLRRGAADDDGQVVGGQAAVPRVRIFSSRKERRRSGFSSALVS